MTDIYHDNVVVNWTPPADDGGTELTRWGNISMKNILNIFTRKYLSRYVVEALDRTLGGDWFQVGEAAPGDRKVGINFYFNSQFLILFLTDEDRATGAQTPLQVPSASC